MPQSLASILIHITFSTKNRQPLILESIEEELYRYLAAICKESGCPAHQINGVKDHIHVLLTLSRTIPLSKIIEELKKRSSKWIKTKEENYSAFKW